MSPGPQRFSPAQPIRWPTRRESCWNSERNSPPPASGEVVFTLRGRDGGLRFAETRIVVNGHRAPAPLKDGKVTLIALVDRTGLEVFAADGLCYVPMPFQAKPADLEVSVKATGGEVKFSELAVYELRSMWDMRR